MTLANNLLNIQKNIARTHAKQKPILIAVSKQQSDEILSDALENGLRVFGENRVQEAQLHWQNKRAQYPNLELHLIGPLQSNKARDAIALFDVIHTIDRESIIDALSNEMKKQNKNIPCFVQVNTGNEAQKAGILPHELPALLDYARARNINVVGLMCIPPVNDAAGIHFTFLRKLARRYGLQNLSMGMSDDYEVAVKAGATHIRVGSALFGART
jgi:pyridoxal phosphate enzyme (YggS family)